MNHHEQEHESSRLAREISDRPVRALFERFVNTWSTIHDDVHIQSTSVELRFFYKDRFLCRLAPYRELFHVQVGEDPGWECRVRSEEGFADTMDRALERFLHVYGSNGP